MEIVPPERTREIFQSTSSFPRSCGRNRTREENCRHVHAAALRCGRTARGRQPPGKVGTEGHLGRVGLSGGVCLLHLVVTRFSGHGMWSSGVETHFLAVSSPWKVFCLLRRRRKKGTKIKKKHTAPGSRHAWMSCPRMHSHHLWCVVSNRGQLAAGDMAAVDMDGVCDSPGALAWSTM